jgi:pimeloyl-ACP methyl ester carboxylesterase
LRSQWYAVNGMRVHARVSVNAVPPERPTLVLVHGLGVSSRYMIPTAQELARTYRVYAPDLPGVGKSDRPPRAMTIPELADALAAWMQAAGLGSAVLVGNSLGCQVIVDFALRYAARLQRVVLVGATIDPEARGALRQIGRGLFDVVAEPPALWPILVHDYLVAGPFRSLQTLRYALQDPIEQKLPQVRAPALVVRGAGDTIVPPRWAEEMTRLLPAARLVVIPGACHAVNFSHPRELARVIVPFVPMKA